MDAQMKCKVFYKEKFMIIQIRPVLLVGGIGSLLRDLFFPSVYDALFLIRPSCNFRDGRLIKNYTVNFSQYFIELPFNDGYLGALIHLIPANYRSRLDRAVFRRSLCKDLSPINLTNIVLGFAPVFLFIKSYGSCPTGEVSQLCYKGVLRRIALGSTDGMCTWRCSGLSCFQPIIVPVGRIALGRIFNVVGCIIDPYIDFSLSSQFNTRIPIRIGELVESHENLTYTLRYPNNIFRKGSSSFSSHTQLHLTALWNTMIINRILQAWIFYIGYLYQNRGRVNLDLMI